MTAVDFGVVASIDGQRPQFQARGNIESDDAIDGAANLVETGEVGLRGRRPASAVSAMMATIWAPGGPTPTAAHRRT